MNRKQTAMRVIKEALIEDDAIRLADELDLELSYPDDMDDFYDACSDYDNYEDYYEEDDSNYDLDEYVDYGYSDFALADDWGY